MIKRIASITCLLAIALVARATAEATSGTWTMQTTEAKTYMDMRWSDGDHRDNENGHSIDPKDFGIDNIMGLNGHVTFKLHRDAGDFAYEGWMQNGSGGGNYTFTTNDAFFKELTRRGYDVSEIQKKMTFAFLDITMAYVNSIEAAGYRLTVNKLITFKALNINEQYLNELKSAGITDLGEERVVSLKALKVDLAYIRDLDSVGFGHMDAREYVTFKAMKIDSAYIKYLGAHGFHNLTPEQVVRMKAMKV